MLNNKRNLIISFKSWFSTHFNNSEIFSYAAYGPVYFSASNTSYLSSTIQIFLLYESIVSYNDVSVKNPIERKLK